MLDGVIESVQRILAQVEVNHIHSGLDEDLIVTTREAARDRYRGTPGKRFDEASAANATFTPWKFALIPGCSRRTEAEW